MANNIIEQFLSELGVSHTHKFVEECMRKQPFRDSLYAFSSLLNRYNITNETVKLTDRTALSSRFCPMIVALKWQYVVVTDITDESVTIVNANGKQQDLSREFFDRTWDGVALVADPDSLSSEPDLEHNRKNQRISYLRSTATIAAAAVVAGFAYVSNTELHNVWLTLILLINNLGVYVGILLTQKDLHIKNRVADKLCGLVKQSDCSKVTASDASMIFGVKLSAVGLGFFSTNIITLLTAPAMTGPLAVYAIGALPFTLWSVWYQKFRARSWCVLCLCTLGLMWGQALIFIFAVCGTFHFDLIGFLVLGALYILAVMCARTVTELLKAKEEREKWEYNFIRLKAEPAVIGAFMARQPLLDTSRHGCSRMIFGNPEAPDRITLLSNPYCQPCGLMHSHIEKYPGEDICVQYAMTYFKEEQSVINRYIIAAYMQLGPERTWRMLTGWYAGGKTDGEAFFEHKGLDISAPGVEEEFRRHCDWVKKNHFHGTPTVIVNGRELTGPYSVEDYRLLSNLKNDLRHE